MPKPGELAAAGQALGELLEQKNAAYGSAFHRAGDVLNILYPDGIRPEQYVDVLITVRILDKLFRVANKKDAFGESPWQDISGYGLLGAAIDKENRDAAHHARR